MSFTYETILGLRKPSDDDQDHGDELRQNIDALGQALAPENVWWVSPDFTQANLACDSATDRRHFDTIQGAINAAESSLGDSGAEAAIIVFPGRYQENLTVSHRVGLFGVNAHGLAVADGGAMPAIIGSGSASPVFTFSPASSATCYLTVQGFNIWNQWNGNTGSAQSWPMILDTDDQGAGNYGAYTNRVTFKDCAFRNQIPSGNDSFGECFNVEAFIELVLIDCQLRQPTDSGALSTYLIKLAGNLATSKTARLAMKRCEVESWYRLGTAVVRGDYGSEGFVYSTSFSRARSSVHNPGSNGTNELLGVADDLQLDDYLNRVSINPVVW